jgi:hypothetical protein
MTNHPLRVSRMIFAASITALGGALMMTPARADDASDLQGKLNGGYYLLHSVSEDEAQLPLLLDLKHAPAEVIAYADRISKGAKETAAAVEHFQDRDSAIQFDKNPLPQIEQDVRKSIKADKQHQLLFGTTNSEFVRALMVSQIEASTYALNICKVLADEETNPARSKKLRQLSAKWLDLRDEAFRILRDY